MEITINLNQVRKIALARLCKILKDMEILKPEEITNLLKDKEVTYKEMLDIIQNISKNKDISYPMLLEEFLFEYDRNLKENMSSIDVSFIE